MVSALTKVEYNKEKAVSEILYAITIYFLFQVGQISYRVLRGRIQHCRCIVVRSSPEIWEWQWSAGMKQVQVDHNCVILLQPSKVLIFV